MLFIYFIFIILNFLLHCRQKDIYLNHQFKSTILIIL